MKNKFNFGDPLLWLAILGLFITSSLMLLVSGNSERDFKLFQNIFLIRNIEGYIIGCAVMLILSNFLKEIWLKQVNNIALFLVLISIFTFLFGPRLFGRSNWVKLFFFYFDIRELLLFGLVLILPKTMNDFKSSNQGFSELIRFLLPFPTFCILYLFWGGNVGTGIICLVIITCFWREYKVRNLYTFLFLTGILWCSFGAGILLHFNEFDLNNFANIIGRRIEHTPEQVFQIRQSFKNGGLSGIYWSSNKTPTILFESTNHLSFWRFVELFGIVGFMLPLGFLGLLIQRLQTTVSKLSDPYGVGFLKIIKFSILIQTIFFLLSPLGTISFLGVKLPFLPLIGSASIFLFIQLGIVQALLPKKN